MNDEEYLEKDSIHDLSTELKHKHSIREIPISEIFDYANRLVYIRRVDTGEIVPGRFRHMAKDEIETEPDMFQGEPSERTAPSDFGEGSDQ